MAYEINHPEKTLSEILQQHTIAELKRCLSELSLKIKSGLRKDLMVRATSKWILEHPEVLVNHLFTYELRMYDDIINHPENELLIPVDLTRLPFDSVTPTDYSIRSYIATDLADRLKPLLADVISLREKSGEEAVENHIIGQLNLRGAMKYDEVLDFLLPKMENSDVHDDIIFRINRFAAGNDVDDEVVIESPFISATEFNFFDSRCVDPDTEPKEFTEDEIAQAAIMPYPHIGGQARETLKKQLIALGKKDSAADEFLLFRWLEKQNDSMNPLQGLSALEYGSFEQFQELLPLLTDYVNKMPFWKFKGWSSEEIAGRGPKLKRGQMPHIVMGPNMRSRGITSFEQLQKMTAKGDSISGTPFSSAKKVGRNDPCPCGSGKKYKHCCGR